MNQPHCSLICRRYTYHRSASFVRFHGLVIPSKLYDADFQSSRTFDSPRSPDGIDSKSDDASRATATLPGPLFKSDRN